MYCQYILYSIGGTYQMVSAIELVQKGQKIFCPYNTFA